MKMKQIDNTLSGVCREDEQGCVLQCRQCNHQTVLYSPQKVQAFICPQCKTIYYPSFNHIQRLKKSSQPCPPPVVPLYSRCRFDRDYTVVGYARKQEKNDRDAVWEEYTLADDDGNYAFLSVSYGHWILLHECAEPAQYTPDTPEEVVIGDDGNQYQPYSSYEQKIQTAVGEFPYNIGRQLLPLTREYIAPPFILTCEYWGEHRVYFHGRYLTPAQVRKAFDNAFPLPPREGVGSCQPFYGGIRYSQFAVTALLLFVCSLVLFMMIQQQRPTPLLTHIEIPAGDTVLAKGVVSPAFDVQNSLPVVLQMECYSSVKNDWVEGELVLVNERTGEEKSLFVGIEYYTGVVDGEVWTEGSPWQTVYLDQVSPGRYHVEARAYSAFVAPTGSFAVNVSLYYATPWNYWLIVGVLGAIVFVIVFAGKKFEEERYGLTSVSHSERQL